MTLPLPNSCSETKAQVFSSGRNASVPLFIYHVISLSNVKLLMVLLFLVSFGYGQNQKEFSGTDNNLKNEWIAETIKYLAVTENVSHFPVLQIDTYEKGQNQFTQKIRLKGEGILKFNDNLWIVMKSHSSHDNSNIGDIVISSTNAGNFYVNDGHICGGIISFVYDGTVSLQHPDFFFSHFTSESESSQWKLLNP